MLHSDNTLFFVIAILVGFQFWLAGECYWQPIKRHMNAAIMAVVWRPKIKLWFGVKIYRNYFAFVVHPIMHGKQNEHELGIQTTDAIRMKLLLSRFVKIINTTQKYYNIVTIQT